MRSSFLIIIGIGLPLVAMLAMRRYVDAPAPSAHPPVASRPTAAAEPARRDQGSMLRTFPVGNERVASRPAESQPSALDTLDHWLSRWEQAARDNPDSQRAEAAELLRQQHYEAAARAFDRLLVRDANNPLIATGKAMALTALGRDDDALPLLENLARRLPDDVSAQFNYAAALMRTPQQAPALAALHHVVKLDPGHPRALFNMAVLLQAMKKPQDALAIWRQLTDAAEPATPQAVHRADAPATKSGDLSKTMLADAWSHRGELALELKQSAEAEQCFLQTVRIEPRNAQAWYNVGIARTEQFRRSDALTALSIALQIDPDFVPALNQTAYLQAANYRDTGDAACGRAVVESCRHSLRMNPNQPNIFALQQAARQFDPAP